MLSVPCDYSVDKHVLCFNEREINTGHLALMSQRRSNLWPHREIPHREKRALLPQSQTKCSVYKKLEYSLGNEPDKCAGHEVSVSFIAHMTFCSVISTHAFSLLRLRRLEGGTVLLYLPKHGAHSYAHARRHVGFLLNWLMLLSRLRSLKQSLLCISNV